MSLIVVGFFAWNTHTQWEDVQWLRGQKEVGGQKKTIFVHVHG